jgi:predicted TIM-barrel fold metal-dependent hydrolase
MIMSGVFHRHPELRVMLAEFECGWIPFFLEDLDVKLGSVLDAEYASTTGLTMLPSEYFARNMMADFLQDGTTGFMLQRWGVDNFCFSNDYPHLGGIWPFSDDVISNVMGELPAETRRKVLGENAARFFRQPMPSAIERIPLPSDIDAKRFEKPWLKKSGFSFDKPKMGLAV